MESSGSSSSASMVRSSSSLSPLKVNPPAEAKSESLS